MERSERSNRSVGGIGEERAEGRYGRPVGKISGGLNVPIIVIITFDLDEEIVGVRCR